MNIPLDTPNQVTRLLATANRRRAVAATLMNERSSRSHSVFTLKVTGHNPLTGESCDGALNLVDLAGSERLNSSGAGDNKARLQETISINSSLSALKDVIEKLGHGDLKHVPYRNSKLTYLLQTSLSGECGSGLLLFHGGSLTVTRTQTPSFPQAKAKPSCYATFHLSQPTPRNRCAVFVSPSSSTTRRLVPLGSTRRRGPLERRVESRVGI